MRKELLSLVSGEVLEEDVELTLVELCQACRMQAEQVLDLVEQGVIEPLGHDPARWRFRGVSMRRVRLVQRLERDLGVNVAGAALALELLEELERLRARLRRLEG
jgi:chaperone modulatory protein CbpM